MVNHFLNSANRRRAIPLSCSYLAALVFAFSICAVQAADVSVSLQSNTVPANRELELSVTIQGGSVKSLPMPPVPDGVNIRPYRRSQNFQFINGQMSQSITQSFLVNASQPGDYTIPSFEIQVGGETLKTDPVSFKVTPANSPTPPPAPGNPRQQPSAASPDAPAQPLGQLRLDFPKRERDYLYVGEMAPIRIKAYFPPDTRGNLKSDPRPEGQGFTLHNLSEKPETGYEEIGGQTYQTLTWFAGVSMAKAGEYPINVSLDVTVMVPDESSSGRSRPRSPFGRRSIFNDPFFDDFFNNTMRTLVPREVTLTSPGDPLEVRSLPQEGRPANFSGAVGDFSLGSFRLPAEAAAGEPQQVRVTIEGKGNFERMSSPVLEPAGAWKSYTPKVEFKAEDAASFSGHKTFEFSAVPRKSGEQKVKLAFSYFNPETGTYESIDSPQIAMNVTGNDVAPERETVAANAAAPRSGSDDAIEDSPKDKAASTPQNDLAPLRLNVAAAGASLKPLIHRPDFLAGLGIALTGIAAGFVVGAVRRGRDAPDRVAARRSKQRERDALASAEKALREGDTQAFFDSARRALQIRSGALWNLPADALTQGELRKRLPPDSPVLTIFSQADALAYAPEGSKSAAELERWNQLLHQGLESLTESPTASRRAKSSQPVGSAAP